MEEEIQCLSCLKEHGAPELQLDSTPTLKKILGQAVQQIMLLPWVVKFDELCLLEKGDRILDRELADDRIREIPAQLVV